MGVVKDRASGHGELVFAVHALVEVAGLAGFPLSHELGDAFALTLETAYTSRPADLREVGDAGFLSAELLYNFDDGWWSAHGI
jgi:hypothetical protein